MGVNEEKLASLDARSEGSASDIAPSSEVSSRLDRWLARKLLDVVGDPPFSIHLWDGTVIQPLENGARCHLQIRDRAALWKLVLDPELHFGRLYSAERVEVDGDLVQFLEWSYLGLREAGESGAAVRLLKWLNKRPRRNSLRGSRHNIHHHYDIGNAFYALWLDTEAMQYTCAYYPEPDMTLEEAQVAKLHHVCRKLQLKPGDTVVEAGCGWGGLARFMARHYGVTVKAYNISHEQVKFARQKAEEEGLADRVEYIEDDYRNISGIYDVFVSVGMLEHVGPKYYRELGDVIHRCLKSEGRGLIHTIGRRQPGLMNAWIEKHIFPGACPPSLAEMMDIFEPHEFAVQDVENLRLHYAKTLRHWLERYEANLDTIREDLGFDENFIRAWRLYLSGSIAAFTTNELQLYQVVFTGPQRHELPWSRKHLYE